MKYLLLLLFAGLMFASCSRQEQAAEVMRRGRDALIEVGDHLLPDRSHREWLDSSEGAYIEKSAENKDVTVYPAIMIPAGNGLITVAPGRVDLRSKDVIVEDTDPLTAQEWEIIEAMGNLREFSYVTWTDELFQ